MNKRRLPEDDIMARNDLEVHQEICCEGCYRLGIKKGRLDVLKDEKEFLEEQNKEFDFQFLKKSNNLRWINNKRLQEITKEINEIEGEWINK